MRTQNSKHEKNKDLLMIYIVLAALIITSLSYDDSMIRPRGRPEDEIDRSQT